MDNQTGYQPDWIYTRVRPKENGMYLVSEITRQGPFTEVAAYYSYYDAKEDKWNEDDGEHKVVAYSELPDEQKIFRYGTLYDPKDPPCDEDALCVITNGIGTNVDVNFINLVGASCVAYLPYDRIVPANNIVSITHHLQSKDC